MYRLKSRINQYKQHQPTQVGTDSEAVIGYERSIENNQRMINQFYLQISRLESRSYSIGCTR